MYAWLSRGLVSISDLAAWRFDNDESKVADLMKQTPNQIRALLSLDAIPDVGDAEEKKRVKEAQNALLPGAAQQKEIYIIHHQFSTGKYKTDIT